MLFHYQIEILPREAFQLVQSDERPRAGHDQAIGVSRRLTLQTVTANANRHFVTQVGIGLDEHGEPGMFVLYILRPIICFI